MADTREVVITIRGDSIQPKTKLEKDKEQQKDLKALQKMINNPVGSSFDILEEANKLTPLQATAGYMLASETVKLIGDGISFAAQNIGRWTGDIGAVRTVQKVQIAKQIAGQALSIGMGAITGKITLAAVGATGPAGAIIGASIAALNVASSYARQAYEFSTAIATDDRTVLFLKQRAGTVKTDWSR